MRAGREKAVTKVWCGYTEPQLSEVGMGRRNRGPEAEKKRKHTLTVTTDRENAWKGTVQHSKLQPLSSLLIAGIKSWEHYILFHLFIPHA